MQKLVHGIHSFQANSFRSQQELFERLAAGQHPEALLITCSDSRIDPSLITQTKPGDLFVLRNAGNIIPPHGGGGTSGEQATIEFAIVDLGIKDIIVCGHSHCGAIKALLAIDLVRESMPCLCAWLNHAETTRQIVRHKYADLPDDRLLNVAIQENVLVQLENLRTQPAVAAALATGAVKLHGWIYKFESGQVFSYDPASGQFQEVGRAANAASADSRRRSPQLQAI